MKIIVSIPVHEKPEIIKDQVANLKKFIENVTIVLHVSKSYFINYRIEEISNIPDVYINPVHMDTKWADIIHTHISNFEFIDSIEEFDYFLMHASNDMYVKKGIEGYIKNYEAGFNIRKVIAKHSFWWPGDAACRDEQLKQIMNQCGQSMIIASQIEGSFYKRDVMRKMIKIIKENYNYSLDKENYTREEFYFSTVASSLVDWLSVGRPTTYSEVHKFDRFIWKWKSTARIVYRFFKWCIPVKTYIKFEIWSNDFIFKLRFYRINSRLIKKILADTKDVIESNRYLNDGSGMFELYEGKNIFSVKRVEREYGNSVRRYIRELR